MPLRVEVCWPTLTNPEYNESNPRRLYTKLNTHQCNHGFTAVLLYIPNIRLYIFLNFSLQVLSRLLCWWVNDVFDWQVIIFQIFSSEVCFLNILCSLNGVVVIEGILPFQLLGQYEVTTPGCRVLLHIHNTNCDIWVVINAPIADLSTLSTKLKAVFMNRSLPFQSMLHGLVVYLKN